MNEHLDETAFRALHESHGVLEERDLPVRLPGDAKYIVIMCPADNKSITKLVGAKELLMPKKDKVDVTAPVQPPLVPLTEKEVSDLQQNLPVWIGDLEAMKTKHAGLRAEMKGERSELQKKINNGAQQLRDNGR